MFQVLRLAMTMSVFATACSAQTTPTCDFTGPTIFPEMETAKAFFLQGDFDGFFGFAGKGMPQAEGLALMESIATAVPDGFVSCSTVVQRQDVGGMVQEVTLFQRSEDQGFIGLYVQSALIDGQRVIMLIKFDSLISAVTESMQ
jgi:hypothetical protein